MPGSCGRENSQYKARTKAATAVAQSGAAYGSLPSEQSSEWAGRSWSLRRDFDDYRLVRCHLRRVFTRHLAQIPGGPQIADTGGNVVGIDEVGPRHRNFRLRRSPIEQNYSATPIL